MKHLIVYFLLIFTPTLHACSIGDTGEMNYTEFIKKKHRQSLKEKSKIRVDIAEYQRPLPGNDSCSNIGYLTIAIYGKDTKSNLYSFNVRSKERAFLPFEKTKGAYRGSIDERTGAAIFVLRMTIKKKSFDFSIDVEALEFDPNGNLIGKGNAGISSSSTQNKSLAATK